jgi:DNA-binding NarL/FixJ family response regulator
MTIRVLIADDHGVVAEGLRNLLEAQADMEVVALVEDGRGAVRCATENPPDVVLMDVAMRVSNERAISIRSLVAGKRKSRYLVIRRHTGSRWLAPMAGAGGLRPTTKPS